MGIAPLTNALQRLQLLQCIFVAVPLAGPISTSHRKFNQGVGNVEL